MNSGDKPDSRPKATEGKLFEEFSPSSYAEWRAEVERILKGASFEDKMLTKTFEGITLKPIYNNVDINPIHFQDAPPGFSPFTRGNDAIHHQGHAWEIAQEINYPDIEEFNEALLHDIENGLTAVTLPLDLAGRLGYDPDHAHRGDTGRHGVSISSMRGLSNALKSVNLADFPVYIQCGISGLPYLGLFMALAKRNGISTSGLRGAIAMDPLGELVRQGELSETVENLYDEMAEMTNWAIQNAPGLGTFWIHGEYFSEGGGTAVQELAFALTIGVEYLRAMESRGIEPEKSAAHFRFSFAQGANFFMEAAKLRAARLLWNRILEECGVPKEFRKMHIHVRTSRYTKTTHDPYVNLLRSTIETLSGIVGGANGIYSAPFDEHIRPADEFSRRLARNIQLILKEETHLDQIMDPAGGSWFMEKLTSEIAEESWKLFQEVESLGGMHRSLLEGLPQARVSASADEKAGSFALRRSIMVGTNKYPNPAEEKLGAKPFDYRAFHEKRTHDMEELHAASTGQDEVAVLGRLDQLVNASRGEIVDAIINAVGQGATVGEIIRTLRMGRKTSVSITPIPQIRAGEPFERLRIAVEKQRAAKNDLKVYLATIGPAGKYMPRLDFSAQFFEIGGFDVIRTMGHDTPEEAANNALDENASIVVICGRDDSYPDNAPLIASQVKKANLYAIVVLAGIPQSETLKTRYLEAGIDLFIHKESNVLETLTDLASRLGVI